MTKSKTATLNDICEWQELLRHSLPLHNKTNLKFFHSIHILNDDCLEKLTMYLRYTDVLKYSDVFQKLLNISHKKISSQYSSGTLELVDMIEQYWKPTVDDWILFGKLIK